MSEAVPAGPAGRRRVGAALLITLAVTGLLAGVAHLSPVRQRVFARAAAWVAASTPIRIEATRFDYNLFTRRIAVTDLRVSARGRTAQPFFTARRLDAVIPWPLFRGVLGLESLIVDGARVVVVRGPDGATNLPASSGAGGAPPAFPVGRLVATDLGVHIVDAPSDLSLDLTGLSVDLSAHEGRLDARGAGRLSVADRTLSIPAINGGVSFDGRVVRLDNLAVGTDVGTLRADGRVGVLQGDPQFDLRLRVLTDLTRVSFWSDPSAPDRPSGEVAIDARVRGALAEPRADLALTAADVRWRGLRATETRAAGTITSARAVLDRATLLIAGGRLDLGATVDYGVGEPRVALNGNWGDIDLAVLAAPFVGRGAIRPDGTTAGSLRAAGPLNGLSAWTGDARMQVRAPEPVRAGRISLPGDTRATLAGGEWRLESDTALAGLVPTSIRLSGRVAAGSGSPIRGEVTIGDADLLAATAALRHAGLLGPGMPAPEAGRLSARLTIGGRLAQPALHGAVTLRDLLVPAGGDRSSIVQLADLEIDVDGEPLRPRLAFDARANGLLAFGEHAASGTLTGRVDRDVVQIERLALEQGTGGRAEVRGTYVGRSRRVTLDADVSAWRIVPTAERPLSGVVDAVVSGTGAVDRPEGALRLTLGDGTWDGLRLGPVAVEAQFDGDRAQVHGSASDWGSSADATVALAAPYDTVIDLHARDLDLAPWLRSVSSPAPLAARLTADIHGVGPLRNWRSGRAEVMVTGLDASAGDLHARLDQAARVRFEAGVVAIDRLVARIGDTRLVVTGGLALDAATARGMADAPAIQAALEGDLDSVLRAADAAGVLVMPVRAEGGAVSVRAVVDGSLERPRLSGDLAAGPSSVTATGWPTVSNLQIRTTLADGVIRLDQADATFQGAQVSATGSAPLGWLTGEAPVGGGGDAAPARLSARLRELTPAVAAPWLDPGTLAQMAGVVDATVELSGASRDLSDLSGEVRLDRMDLTVADLPVTQRIPTRVVVSDGVARVEAWDWAGQGATLNVAGQIRLADRLAALLVDGALDLRLASPLVHAEGVRLGGTVAPHLRVTGPLDALQVDGELTLDGGEVRLADPRLDATGLSGRVTIDRNVARIAEFGGTLNGGALEAGGEVAYQADGRLSGFLSAEVRDAALAFPAGLRSQLDGTVVLDVESALDGEDLVSRLSGDVSVTRASYREPLAVIGGVMAALRARAAAPVESEPSVLDRLALDVRISTDEDVQVDNNYGRFQVGADLRLIGTAMAPAVAGRAELREGGRLFLGRNAYRIESGAVDFTSATAIEPDLTLQATTRAGGEDIVVTVRGTPDALTSELRSTSAPELGQADLTALLVTGRRLDDLSAADAAFIGEQVVGNLSGEVLGFAGRAVGLDTLRLGGVEGTVGADLTSAATDLDPTSRLTFGKRLGPRVDLTFSQSLRDGQAQTWIVDYLPARRLNLRLLSNDADLRSYEVRHDVTFGGAVRPAAAAAVTPDGRTAADAGSTDAQRRARVRETRVTEVRIEGADTLGEARVRGVLTLRAGDVFEAGRLQSDRDRVLALYRESGYFTARVRADRQDGPDGVALVFAIAAGPSTRIVVTGATLDAATMRAIRDAWAEAFLDDQLTDEVKTLVRAVLAADERPAADVSVTVAVDPEGRRLEIHIEPGTRVRTTRVRVSGVEESMASTLEAWLTAQRLAPSPAAAPQQAAAALETHLRRIGWLDARVTAGAPAVEGDVSTVPLVARLGDSFTVGQVWFEVEGGSPGGDGVPGVDALSGAASLASGVALESTQIGAAGERVLAVLRRAGFAGPRLVAQQRRRPLMPVVDVVFRITPGQRRTIQDVTVAGLGRVREDVVRRAAAIPVGEPLRAEDLVAARRRLFDTGLFRRVDVQTDALGGAEAGAGGPTATRVRLVVEEWPALRLRYGFQAAEERPETSPTGRTLVPGLSADVTRRTLFGRAVGLGGAVVLQLRERTARGFVTMPALFARKIESSLIVEAGRREFAAATLVTAVRAVSWEQRTRVGTHLRVSYAYRFERNHTSDTDTTPRLGFPAFDVTLSVARLTGNTAWDTRDDPVDTGRGTLISSSLEWAATRIGSDIGFLRHLAQAYHFQPWRGAVLASAVRLGVVTPLGGQELVASERFMGGGARSLRGVDEDGLGGRDFLGDPKGGGALLLLNQEVRIPIGRGLRGVGFVDVGNVFDRPRDLTVGRLVGSAGGGVRLSTPFALLRVDYGRVVWGASGGVTGGRWTFGIGHAF